MTNPEEEHDPLDLDALFNEAEEAMAGADEAQESSPGAADPPGGFAAPMAMPTEEPMAVEEEQEPDEDVLAMLQQIEGGWHDGDGSLPQSAPKKDKKEKPNDKKGTTPQSTAAAAAAARSRAQSNDDGVGVSLDEPVEGEGYEQAMEELRETSRGCNDLAALLLRPGHEAVLLLESTVPVAKHNDLATALVELFEPFGQGPALLRLLLTRNIESTATEDILMRNESLAMRCMRAYLQKVAAPYIQAFMTPQLQTLLTTELATEIEPEDNEIPDGMTRKDAIYDAATNLVKLSGDLLDAIEAVERGESNIARTPWEVRYIMWAAYAAAKARFPGAEHHAASSILFLRLLTPVITMGGKNFKLVLDQNLLRQKRRVTTLVGKIIQYIANGVLAEMPQPLPGFIEEKISENKGLMDLMASSMPMEALENLRYPAMGDADAISEALKPMAEFAIKNEKVLTFEEERPGVQQLTPLEEELAAAVGQVVEEHEEIPQPAAREDRSGSVDNNQQLSHNMGCCVIC